MKKHTKLLISIVFLLIAAATVFVVQRRSEMEEAAANSKQKVSTHQPGIVRFGAGEPQLSAIRSEQVSAEPIPTADPVNGRIVYDENATSRISSPLTGRVLRLQAGVGDPVKRGAALLEIDAPDLANAEADQQKAISEEMRKTIEGLRYTPAAALGTCRYKINFQKKPEQAAKDMSGAIDLLQQRTGTDNLPVLTQDRGRVRFYDDLIKGRLVLVSAFFTQSSTVKPSCVSCCRYNTLSLKPTSTRLSLMSLGWTMSPVMLPWTVDTLKNIRDVLKTPVCASSR